jgi:drug/metabolite transporter (DMT)-like permease
MTGVALGLILIAAFAHATWNLLAKKACGGTEFIWLFTGMSVAIWAPVAAWIVFVQKPTIGWTQVGFILLSAFLQSFYFGFLDKGYEKGDMSIVYPVSRGTGPLIAAFAGIAFLGERPTWMGILGIGLMAAGIMALTGNPLDIVKSGANSGIVYALLCGVSIAAYTICDKIAVSRIMVPPVLMEWGTNLARFIMLTPYIMKHRGEVAEQWKVNWANAIGIGALCPLAYTLVLTAMVVSPVSYIAPAREISILIGTIMGTRLLSEKPSMLKFIGSGAMLVGLIVMSLG